MRMFCFKQYVSLIVNSACRLLVEQVFDCSTYSRNPTLSYYVRQYAVRALVRIMESNISDSSLWGGFEDRVFAVLYERMNDDAIEVRRVSACKHVLHHF